MSYFQLSSLRLFQNLGRALTGADWDYNWSQFLQVLSGNPIKYDVSFGNILGNSVIAPVIGNASSVFYGDGSNLTGSTVNRREYSTFSKYIYKTPSLIEFNNINTGDVVKITAELGIDAGILLDVMDNITGWVGSEAGVNVALNTTNYLNGAGAVSFDKNASDVLARIQKTYISFNGTSARFRADCKVPDLTNFAALRIYFQSNKGVDYVYYDITNDVAGNPIHLGWNKVEVDLSDMPSGTGGSFNVGAIIDVDLGIVTSVAAQTLTGIKWQDLIYYKLTDPTTLLDVDVIADYDTVLKDVGDTYTFEALRAGVPVDKTIFATPGVLPGSVISTFPKNVPAGSPGQNLKITVTVQ